MRWAAVLLLLLASGVGAQTVEYPLRPLARGEAPPPPPMRPNLRPYERPDLRHFEAGHPYLSTPRQRLLTNPSTIKLSPVPPTRPRAIERAAEARRLAVIRGQVCGDPSIQGKTIGRVNGRGACGITNAVEVRRVAGVRLTPAATLDCRTASALKRWVQNGAKPAVGAAGGGIASLRVVSHYACRNRNSAASGKLSEHSFGRAIDIAGIKLKSGREITVLRGWNAEGDGRRLRAMWRAACGPFGTVLGPNANKFHLDHFHFDTARYRSGSYCR